MARRFADGSWNFRRAREGGVSADFEAVAAEDQGTRWISTVLDGPLHILEPIGMSLAVFDHASARITASPTVKYLDLGAAPDAFQVDRFLRFQYLHGCPNARRRGGKGGSFEICATTLLLRRVQPKENSIVPRIDGVERRYYRRMHEA